MTKIITGAIIVLFLFGGWELYFYWEKVKNDEETAQKQAVAAQVVPEQLAGMPWQQQQQLEASLKAAQSQGPAALRAWIKTYGKVVQDPRKAWIELDYCMEVSREDLGEARRVFAEVKARTPQNSPIWPRIKGLEKTYQ